MATYLTDQGRHSILKFKKDDGFESLLSYVSMMKKVCEMVTNTNEITVNKYSFANAHDLKDKINNLHNLL